MRKLFNKAKKWWSSKGYKERNSFLSSMNLVFILGMAVSVFISPVMQMIMSVLVISTAICGILNLNKMNKAEEQEKADQALKDANERIQTLMAKDQAEAKATMSKETQEAMESLFNVKEKENRNKDADRSDEEVLEPSSTNSQEFNKLFHRN